MCVFFNAFTHHLYFPSALCKCAGLFTSLFLSLPFSSLSLNLSLSLSLSLSLPHSRIGSPPRPCILLPLPPPISHYRQNMPDRVGAACGALSINIQHNAYVYVHAWIRYLNDCAPSREDEAFFLKISLRACVLSDEVCLRGGCGAVRE